MEASWFGVRLRELRTLAGLTQAALATLTGLNKFTIAQLEQGRSKPYWETVLTLAKALGVTPNAFAEKPGTTVLISRGRPPKVPDLVQADFPVDDWE